MKLNLSRKTMSIPSQFDPLGESKLFPNGYKKVEKVYFDGLTVVDSLIPAKTGYDVTMKFKRLDSV